MERRTFFSMAIAGVSLALGATRGEAQRAYPERSSITTGGSTGPRPLRDRFADVFTVLDYGAKADGVTDDTDAINAALAACYNAGGGLVFVPHGKYLIRGKIVQGANTTLCCDSGTVLVRGAAGGFWANWLGYKTDYTGKNNLEAPSGYAGHGNIAVIGGVWDMKGYEFGGSANGFTIGYADGVLFRDIVIKNGVGAHAVDMCASRHVLIDNCRFLGCCKPSAPHKECIQLDHCAMNSTFFGARDGTPCYDVVIRNCYCGPNPDRRSDGSWPVFVGSHGAHEKGQTRDILVEGCVCDFSANSTQTAMVHAYAWKNVTVKSCTVHGTKVLQCTSVSPSNANMASYRGNENILVEGCTCDHPLAVYSSLPADYTAASNAGRNKNITVSGCTLDGMVEIQGFDGVKIANCTIKNARAQSLFLVACANMTVTGNIIEAGAVQIQSNPDAAALLAHWNYGHLSVVGNTFLNSIIFLRFPLRSVVVADNAAPASTKSFLQCNSVSDTSIAVSGNVYSQDPEAGKAYFIVSNSYSDNFLLSGNKIDLSKNGAIAAANTTRAARDIKLTPVLFKNELNYGGEAPIQFDTFSGVKIAWKQGGRLTFGSYKEDITSKNKNFTEQYACDTGGFFPAADNVRKLGTNRYRWSTVYAGSGIINTSDEREKTQIGPVEDAVMRAWGRVDFQQFKFRDAVASKGADGARIHTGIVAQRVKEAFEAEGLDASGFALFCYDEWQDEYETRTVIDADARYDHEGNEISPAISHKEQVLVRSAGSRYGIRYDEALALECAYQRWKLSQLEAQIRELTGKG
ncbi:MAG: tail fiber domain-containing protein [Desulfovibrio sp.]|nr:tail fiber domain-containing protein [Desulfovibrio sp.]